MIFDSEFSHHHPSIFPSRRTGLVFLGMFFVLLHKTMEWSMEETRREAETAKDVFDERI